MEIALYYAPTTCALAPFVTLTEAGADFEVRALNFRKQEHLQPEYLKINPKHKVPMLEVDGKRLTENVAIHQWVHRNFPAAKLLPADPWDELKAVSLHSWCSGGIHPYLSRINNPGKVAENKEAADSIVKLATDAINENMQIADDLLAGQDWFFDHFTAPDAHFFWCCRRATQFKIDLTGYKNVWGHFNRMLERPSVKKVYAFEKETMDRFAQAA